MEDSGNAIKEKFALSRELNRIRPELEHLQSQLEHYQSMIAERNDLRRQLDAAEEELDNQKRSRQRIQSRDNDAATSELPSQLDKTELRLATEKKERDKQQKAHDKEITQARAQNNKLEEQLSTLKAKMKTLQAELKGANEALDAAQTDAANNKVMAAPVLLPVEEEDETPPPSPRKTPRKTPKRVKAAGDGKKSKPREMTFEDIVIQTPGNEGAVTRRVTKVGGDKTNVGDKSAFSITPFLNRNKSLVDETTLNTARNATRNKPRTTSRRMIEFDAESDENDAPHNRQVSTSKPQSKVAFKSTPTKISPVKAAEKPTPGTPLAESPSKRNSIVKKITPGPKKRSTPRPKRMAEDHDDDDDDDNDNDNDFGAFGQENMIPPPPESPLSSPEPLPRRTNKAKWEQKPSTGPTAPVAPVAEAAPEIPATIAPAKAPAQAPAPVATSAPSKAPQAAVRKKRKLLGGTNSTIFDEDDAEPIVDLPRTTSNNTGKRARTALGGGVKNAFGGSKFSPLKRQRRGANTSFLA